MSSSATTTVSLSSAPIGSRRSCRQRERSGRSSVVRRRRSAMARAFAPRRVSPSISAGAQQTRLTRSERIFVRSVERSSSNAQAESSGRVLPHHRNSRPDRPARHHSAHDASNPATRKIRQATRCPSIHHVERSLAWPRHQASRRVFGGCQDGLVRTGGRDARLHPTGRQPASRGLGEDRRAALVRALFGRAQATLTEAGSILAGHVDELTARMAVAKQDLIDLARGEAGSIRVGAFQSALACILPYVLQRSNSRYPAVQVEAMESNNDIPLLQQVKQGTLDFAFALLPLDSQNFDYRELVLDEFVLVSKRGGSLP